MCEFCNDSKYLHLREKVERVEIFDGQLDIFIDCENGDFKQINIKINYCPMCGKRLE